ncbi:MAG TPA: hypothetical protein VGN42_06960 [Pirellulales bacterium]|jgi:hypothetical protein|nr:hypothetical protein [Pirellulales bacterium]
MRARPGKPGLVFGLTAALLWAAGGSAPAQAPKAGKRPASKSIAEAAGRFRALAPGVEVTIPAEKDLEAVSSRHDLVEVLAADPVYGARPAAKRTSPAKDVKFAHDVWALEFTFKPMRLIEVDVPSKQGRFDRKQIWYLIYRVKNGGKTLHQTTTPDGKVSVAEIDSPQPLRFIPEFRLESWDTGKVYPDRIIPVAVPEIEKREDASRRLLNADKVLPENPSRLFNTIEMEREIPASPAGQDLGVWGVATWEDIDPNTDHFSVYVKGLTNAYRWEDAKAGEPPAYVFKKGDAPGAGRKLRQKTLRLNFWRPSDKYYEHEDEIRYGYYEDSGDERFNLKPEEKVDYLWVYR